MLTCQRVCSVVAVLLAVLAYFVFVPTINFSPADIPNLAVSQNGKQMVAIITGANSGLGYESALEMSAHGAHVVMACRSMGKCETAKTAILEDGRVAAAGGVVECMKLDLGSLKSVASFADAFKARNLPLHVLMLNAGLLLNQKSLSEDGIETVFAVSHVGHHYLTSLLEDLLVASSPSRIVSVSSRAYERASMTVGGIDYDGLLTMEQESTYGLMTCYERAKLANVLHAQKLARRLEGKGVYVNALHPGVVSTEVVRNVQAHNEGEPTWFEENIMSPGLEALFDNLGYDPKTGAMTQVYLAVSPEVEEQNLSMKTMHWPVAVKHAFTSTVNDEEADKLWNWTEKVLADRGFGPEQEEEEDNSEI